MPATRCLQPFPTNPHLYSVIDPNHGPVARFARAFSLIEMVVVIAILLILITAGVSLMNGTGTQARKAGTDMLAGMIEQARTTAITSRTNVILAVAEPGDLPAGDERCRLGLFRVDEWPNSSADPFEAVLLSRWRTLETGVAIIGRQKDEKEDEEVVGNPLDMDEITITYGTVSKPLSVKVHAIAFNPRGGLLFPEGSTPIIMRVAEGGYRNGDATANKRADTNAISENRIQIGRVTARPYRIDG